MEQICLCIDVGGSSIKYAGIDRERNLMDQGKVPTPYEGIEAYLDCLEGIYRKFQGRVQGISLSVPGIIDSQKGVCITAGNLRFADGLGLVEELRGRCKVPVVIMNDAKCAALAESSYGALSDCRDGVVLVLGTGIGGALIKDGQVHMGHHFAAGEFSFIAMDDCVDLPATHWAGINGMPRLLEGAARIKGVPTDQVNGEQVFAWIQEGDRRIQKLLGEYTRSIARMIMNLQFIYDPQRFAIGGGISRQPLLMEQIRNNLDYLYALYPYQVPRAEVVVCRYYNDANLLGAYSNFMLQFTGQGKTEENRCQARL